MADMYVTPNGAGAEDGSSYANAWSFETLIAQTFSNLESGTDNNIYLQDGNYTTSNSFATKTGFPNTHFIAETIGGVNIEYTGTGRLMDTPGQRYYFTGLNFHSSTAPNQIILFNSDRRLINFYSCTVSHTGGIKSISLLSPETQLINCKFEGDGSDGEVDIRGVASSCLFNSEGKHGVRSFASGSLRSSVVKSRTNTSAGFNLREITNCVLIGNEEIAQHNSNLLMGADLRSFNYLSPSWGLGSSVTFTEDVFVDHDTFDLRLTDYAKNHEAVNALKYVMGQIVDVPGITLDAEDDLVISVGSAPFARNSFGKPVVMGVL